MFVISRIRIMLNLNIFIKIRNIHRYLLKYYFSPKGYQGNSITGYGSQKIDIGGLIVGAVVGLGFLIFIPKILYLLFSTTNIFGAQPIGNGYSVYGRSK